MSSELKRSLEGRIPAPDQPVCIEIQMEVPGVRCVSLLITFFSWDVTSFVTKKLVKWHEVLDDNSMLYS